MSDLPVLQSRSSLLILVMLCFGSLCTASEPQASPAIVWDLGTLAGQKTYPTTITAANLSCRGKHSFSIFIVDTPWLRVTGPPTLEKISMGESKVTNAVVDPRGLDPGEYRGRVVIRCTSCPPPPKCQQNLSELEVRMSVHEDPAPPGGARDISASTLSDQAHADLGKGTEGLPPSKESFRVRDRNNGLVADYSFLDRSMVLEFSHAERGSLFRARDAALGEIIRLKIPAPASTFSSREAIEGAGELVVGERFRRARAEEQLMLLTMLERVVRLVEQELQSTEPESTIVAIRAIPKLVGTQLEGGGVSDKPGIIVVGPNDGRCHGACGPGCSWCLCLSRRCACEVNFLCYLHDSCCGAWEDFFNCFPCTWESGWGASF